VKFFFPVDIVEFFFGHHPFVCVFFLQTTLGASTTKTPIRVTFQIQAMLFFVHLVSINDGVGSRAEELRGGFFHSFGEVNEQELARLRMWEQNREDVFVSCYHQTVHVRIAAITSDPAERAVLTTFFNDYDNTKDCNMIDIILERGQHAAASE